MSKKYHFEVPEGFARPVGKSPSIHVIDEKKVILPHIRIEARAHNKMMALVRASTYNEVSWLGHATVDGSNIVLHDIYVPEQKCSSATTEITGLGKDKIVSMLVKKKKIAVANNLIVWGHSHVNMDVFASGVDEMQTERYLDEYTEVGRSHFVRLIANRRGEMYASLYHLHGGVVYHHVPITCDTANWREWLYWAHGEITTKVNAHHEHEPNRHRYGWWLPESEAKQKKVDAPVVSPEPVRSETEIRIVENTPSIWDWEYWVNKPKRTVVSVRTKRK